MREPVEAFIGLGANLGDARQTVRDALRDLAALPGASDVRASGLWGSTPVDAGGPDYVNAVAVLRTTRNPMDLLTQLQTLETAAGRTRAYRNAPRTLDLDLLLYGSARVACARLQLPHPRLLQRAFVLRPLAQLAPERVDAAALAAVAEQSVWEL